MTASAVARPYDVALLVYNPHSTGGAEGRAHALQRGLVDRAPWLQVRLVPTEYAGHARQIAANAARTERALVVSVSGDGGYNEVVAGAMDAGADVGTRAVVAVAPAGNANDHRRATARRPLADAIADARVERLDLLRLRVEGERRPHYAHSYIGLGISPVVAVELERGGKGSLREIVTTVRGFARFRPFEIEHEGRRERFDSLIFSNTGNMAKYATVADDSDPADGVFEVVALPHRSKLRLLAVALRAAVRGLGSAPQARSYTFVTTSPIPAQLDGEVIELDAGRRVTVEISTGALATVR